MVDLAIKRNNLASNDPCAICGGRTDPAIGPELFMADSWRVVCWDCGREHAPELVALLEAWRAHPCAEILTEFCHLTPTGAVV